MRWIVAVVLLCGGCATTRPSVRITHSIQSNQTQVEVKWEL
jgi:hypothetical protein